jgi:co-chaperonin GroES (HSP10)
VLHPCGALALVRPADQEYTLPSGLILLDTSDPDVSRGEVVAVGPECRDIAAGDRVVWSTFAAEPVEEDDSTLIVYEADVIAKYVS